MFYRLLLFPALLFVAACSYHVEPALLPQENVAILETHYHKGKQYEMNGEPYRAYSSYLAAAKRGHAPAQAALGSLTLRSIGDDVITVQDDTLSAPRKVSRAEMWFELAAKQDDVSGQYRLGELYFHGLGEAKQDIKKALYWYEQAAQQGYLDAQFALGEIYAKGVSNVAENPEKALFWLENPARQGHVQSQYMLGWVHQGAKNFELAKQWYQRAAAQGHYGAEVNLKLITGEFGHYPCYVQGFFGPMRQPGIARRPDDWCIKPP